MSTPHSVLFVCVSNRGKSVMAQGLATTGTRCAGRAMTVRTTSMRPTP